MTSGHQLHNHLVFITGKRSHFTKNSKSQKNYAGGKHIFYDRGPREPGWFPSQLAGSRLESEAQTSQPAHLFLTGEETRRRPAPCCFLVTRHSRVSISIKIFIYFFIFKQNSSFWGKMFNVYLFSVDFDGKNVCWENMDF